jgi:hypothetical protein
MLCDSITSYTLSLMQFTWDIGKSGWLIFIAASHRVLNCSLLRVLYVVASSLIVGGGLYIIRVVVSRGVG